MPQNGPAQSLSETRKQHPGAPENYTNRSPYPMLHLLCEASLSELALTPAELAEIPRRNIATLRDLGTEEILKRLESIRAV